MQLARQSKELGINLCNLIELFVLNQLDNKFQNTSKNENGNENDENEVTFQKVILAQTQATSQVQVFDTKMEALKKRHQDSSEAEIVNACLIHAIENRWALVQKGLPVFINRLKEGKYDA
jgi:hypothetical protein